MNIDIIVGKLLELMLCDSVVFKIILLVSKGGLGIGFRDSIGFSGMRSTTHF